LSTNKKSILRDWTFFILYSLSIYINHHKCNQSFFLSLLSDYNFKFLLIQPIFNKTELQRFIS